MTRATAVCVSGFKSADRNVRSVFGADLTAGLTVAAMLIPQSMAYATLAGLPPVVGLYASILPTLSYAIFGTSPKLAVGPVALDSMLVAGALGSIAQSGTDDYATAAALLAAMIGTIQVVLGKLRAGGFGRRLLSRPVIGGFVTGAAVLIAISQLEPLGLRSVLGGADRASLGTAAVGIVAIGLLLASRRLDKRVPGALIVVVIGVAVSAALQLAEHGVAVVGPIEPGLASPRFSLPTLALLGRLLPSAATIALVGFTEAISVGETFTEPGARGPRPNRELIAIGIANVVAYLVGAYPVTGGLSRTAVNHDAGAQTRWAGAITAAAVALALYTVADLIALLPRAVLAAIVLASVVRLIDARGARALFETDRAQGWVFVATMIVTLVVGIIEGVVVGVAASAAVRVVRSRARRLERARVDAVPLELAPECCAGDPERRGGSPHMTGRTLDRVD